MARDFAEAPAVLRGIESQADKIRDHLRDKGVEILERERRWQHKLWGLVNSMHGINHQGTVDKELDQMRTTRSGLWMIKVGVTLRLTFDTAPRYVKGRAGEKGRGVHLALRTLELCGLGF